jgi:hypothetical protein
MRVRCCGVGERRQRNTYRENASEEHGINKAMPPETMIAAAFTANNGNPKYDQTYRATDNMTGNQELK